MMRPKDDDAARLYIDYNIKPPKELNRQLASVVLRADGNRYDEGFDIGLSAFTSGEYITVICENTEIEIFVEIHKFEIDLKFCRSNVTFGEEYNQNTSGEDWIIVQEFRTQTNSERNMGATFHANAKAGISKEFVPQGAAEIAGNISAGAKKARLEEIKSDGSRKIRTYFHNSIDCVTAISHLDGVPLIGNVISGYKGWRLSPVSTDAASGALARFRVRRNWISMKDASIKSGVGNFAERLRMFLGSETREDNIKRELFPILIEKLTHLKLQDQDDGELATLAASCVVLRPERDQFTQLDNDDALKNIEIDLRAVNTFLNLNSNQVGEYIQKIEATTSSEELERALYEYDQAVIYGSIIFNTEDSSDE